MRTLSPFFDGSFIGPTETALMDLRESEAAVSRLPFTSESEAAAWLSPTKGESGGQD
jgi:hypothetical protein